MVSWMRTTSAALASRPVLLWVMIDDRVLGKRTERTEMAFGEIKYGLAAAEVVHHNF